MDAEPIKWHKIANDVNEINWQQNHMTFVEVAGKKITIARHKDKIFACAYQCPHASGVLSDGYLDALGNLVCPLHNYKFNLVNGRNISGEGYFLKTYVTESRPNGIFIGFE